MGARGAEPPAEDAGGDDQEDDGEVEENSLKRAGLGNWTWGCGTGMVWVGFRKRGVRKEGSYRGEMAAVDGEETLAEGAD